MPVNNLMALQSVSLLVSGPWNGRFPLGAGGLAAFHGFAVIAKTLTRTEPSAIMKRLLKSHAGGHIRLRRLVSPHSGHLHSRSHHRGPLPPVSRG